MSNKDKTVLHASTRAVCIVKPDKRIQGSETKLRKRDAEIEGLDAEIKKIIEAAGLSVVAWQQSKLTDISAESIHEEYRGTEYFSQLVKQATSGEIVALLVEGEDAPQKLWDLTGPEDPAGARIQAPKSIRALLARADESLARAIEERRAVNDVVYVANPHKKGDVIRLGKLFFPNQFT